MRIIYSTYIDHQAEIGYPVEYLKSKNDDLKVFCNEKESERIFELEVSILTKKIEIKQPSDIAIAQNHCIALLFKYWECEFVVWQQADILITETGQQIITDFCKPENIDKTLSLRTTCFKLFHHCGYNDFGINVIGREAWKNPDNHFTQDGAYLGTGGAKTDPTIDAAIEIGYMGIDQSRRHIRQHKITWNVNDPITELPDEDFVKQFVKRHNVNGLISKDSAYYKIVQEMGLEADYEKVKQIVA